MGVSKNVIDRSDVSTYPIKVKYSASYSSDIISSYGMTVNRGINSSYAASGSDALNYAVVKQLYYQEYLTGSLLQSASAWNSNLQSTAAKGTPDYDYRYFPTASNANLTILAIPRTSFGENISRGSLSIIGTAYKLVDDGNGNVIDIISTGSVNYTTFGAAYGINGVRLFDPGYSANEVGTYKEWKSPAVGGSYLGTFWSNPYQTITGGRLNNTGFWSAESPSAIATGFLEFTLSIPSTDTYHIGVSCDNFSSVYVDNSLIVGDYSTVSSDNYRYWDIFPIQLTAGSHIIKLVGTNNDERPVNTVNNPGLMGIEVYGNTSTQISASITSSPLGTSTPAGINLIYSSKDHLTEGVFTKDKYHVGNVIYSQGVIVITNEDYQNALIPGSSYDYYLATTYPCSTCTAGATAQVRVLSGTSITIGSYYLPQILDGNSYRVFSGPLVSPSPGGVSLNSTEYASCASACPVATTTTTTTAAPTTTTSTTSTTTTAALTTTTTTTVAPTTTTTTTVAPTTTTTSTTTSTTTAAPVTVTLTACADITPTGVTRIINVFVYSSAPVATPVQVGFTWTNIEGAVAGNATILTGDTCATVQINALGTSAGSSLIIDSRDPTSFNNGVSNQNYSIGSGQIQTNGTCTTCGV